MDYTILTPEVAAVLAASPSWSDEQIADSLNAKTLTGVAPVRSWSATAH